MKGFGPGEGGNDDDELYQAERCGDGHRAMLKGVLEISYLNKEQKIKFSLLEVS